MLPPGFRMTASARQVLPSGPVEHLVFSDGWLRSRCSSRSAATSAASTVQRRCRDHRLVLGLLDRVQGYRVTAVGEVPPETVRAIAQSIRTASPPPSMAESLLGMGTRSRRRLRRMVRLDLRSTGAVPACAVGQRRHRSSTIAVRQQPRHRAHQPRAGGVPAPAGLRPAARAAGPGPAA